MEGVSKFISALSGFAWPALILAAVVYFRDSLFALIQTLQRQLETGAAFRWKDFEFKGLNILEFRSGTISMSEEAADAVLYEKRQSGFIANKNIFLVHRVRVTGDAHAEVGLPLYDLSIYLVGHKGYGKLNSILKVEYYLGRYFGISAGEFGAKYVVDNGNESFAIRTTAYGPTLCEARIYFHDGTEATINRYLDFEGTGYTFKFGTDELDKQRLLQRAGKETESKLPAG